MKRALFVLVAAFGFSAAAQERIPGADQHVTVPAPPGQANKELLVQPSDAMKQAGGGWVQQGERPLTSGAPRGAASPRRVTQPDTTAASGAPYVPLPQGPTGPAVVGAAFVTVRGTVQAYSKDAITILEKSGRQRQVSLAPHAAVYDGLKAGDEVVLRIPFEEGADCRSADRVERPAAPKPAPKSKFAQAQASGS